MMFQLGFTTPHSRLFRDPEEDGSGSTVMDRQLLGKDGTPQDSQDLDGGGSNQPNLKDDTEVVVKINGKEERVPWKSVRDRFQKEEAAQRRFEEAAEIRRQAEDSVAIRQDLKALVEQEDPDAWHRISSRMGWSRDVAEAVGRKIWGTGGDDDDDDDDLGFDDTDDDDQDEEYAPTSTSRKGRGRGRRAQARAEEDPRVMQYLKKLAEGYSALNRELKDLKGGKTDFSKLSPDVQEELREVARQRSNKAVQAAIDNDEQLSYYWKRANSAQKERVEKLFRREIRDALRGDSSGDLDQAIKTALPEIRKTVEAFGIPGSTSALSGGGLGGSPVTDGGFNKPRKKPSIPSSSNPAQFEQGIMDLLEWNLENT